MAKRKITAFYAWQSDRPQNINRNFIRKALDDAAARITADTSLNVEMAIDADTEGVVGTPHVTETILKKIEAADIFVPDLTFVAQTDEGKLIPNPNVMAEYGYALRALTFEAMMPVMNVHFGGPKELPFDLGHVRFPTQYDVRPAVPDGERRAARDKLSSNFEAILRLMARHIQGKAEPGVPFVPIVPARPPAFFFQPEDVIANFGRPGEQEHRFKRDRAIYLRVYPAYADQPRVGLTRALEVAGTLLPLRRTFSAIRAPNDWGAVSVEPHGDGITSFTQLFETGEIWGVSEEPFRGGNVIPAIAIEKAFVATLENYRLICERELKLRLPLILEFGAVGLKDHVLLVPSAEFPGAGDQAPIRKAEVVSKTEVASFQKEEWQTALRGFAVQLYDAALRDRSQVLTEQHVTANDLPPR